MHTLIDGFKGGPIHRYKRTWFELQGEAPLLGGRFETVRIASYEGEGAFERATTGLANALKSGYKTAWIVEARETVVFRAIEIGEENA